MSNSDAAIKPLISVITVSYNAVSTIEATILSVINQTYPNIEYIIIDGGSTDGTVDIIKKYVDKIAYCVSEPDEGIYDAMNKGILIAKGEWINFMNAGDAFCNSDTLEFFFRGISEGVDIAYGDTIVTLSIGNFKQKNKSLDSIIHGMVFGHQASFVKAELMKEWKFDTSFKSSADYHFFYQAYKKNRKFQYIPLEVAYYEGETGMSVKNHLVAYKEDAQIRGLSKSFRWNCSYFFHILIFKMKKIFKLILPSKYVIFLQKKNLKNRLKE